MSETIEATTFDLVVEEMNLGKLTTNAEALRDMVKGKLEGYSVKNYSGDRIKEAKNDKAELNAFAKKLNDKRLEFERMWMKPFEPFKSVVDETVRLIKTISSKIDEVVKDVEQGEKDEKRREIDLYWSEKKCDLFRLDQIFDERWLNKTTKFQAIQDEIDDRIRKVNADLVTLERLGEPEARVCYLETLDLNKALDRADTLKKNRERLAEDEKRRAEAEVQRKADQEAREKASAEAKEADKANTLAIVDETLAEEGIAVASEPETEPELLEAALHGAVPIVEYSLIVRGPEKALNDLFVYMSARGIEYRRT
jgi:hypothetical protein